MSKKLYISIIGATGKQGGSVAEALLSARHRVRALTRNPGSPEAKALADKGAELAAVDLDDTASLIDGLKGVDAAFGVTTPYEKGTEVETKQGFNIVDAATAAGVKHLLFSSVGSADKNTGIPHFESKWAVEKRLKKSGVPHTIIAPVFFMENWLSPWFFPALKQGNAALAMPADRRLAHISVADIGRFARIIFERPGEFMGRRVDIASDDLSGAEVAEVIGRYSGKQIGFYRIPLEEMRKQNDDFARMFEWFDRVGYNVDIAALKRDFPEVGWTGFEAWAERQDWSALE